MSEKSSIKCCNFKKYGHFAFECRSAKKEQDDQAYVAEATPTTTAASSSNTAAVTHNMHI